MTHVIHTKPLKNGGSDGARTRDLRRDRPSCLTIISTHLPTLSARKAPAIFEEVGTCNPRPPPRGSPGPTGIGTGAAEVNGSQQHGPKTKQKTAQAESPEGLSDADFEDLGPVRTLDPNQYLGRAQVCERYGITRTQLMAWCRRTRRRFPPPVRVEGKDYWSIFVLARWERGR